MKLYADPISTSSRPVTFMAAHASILLEIEPVSLRLGGTRTPEFLGVNPYGKIPVLVDDDFILTESAAILRYLATRAAPQLYPVEARTRARIDESLNWFGTDLYTALAVMMVYPRILPGAFSPTTIAELAAFAEPQVRRILDVLDLRLSGQQHVAGPDLSIADFQALSFLTVSELIAFDCSPWPSITRWIGRMQGLVGWSVSYAGFNGFVAARRAQMQMQH